jgi:hypothetical protein
MSPGSTDAVRQGTQALWPLLDNSSEAPALSQTTGSIIYRTVYRHFFASAQVFLTAAVWGNHTGEIMPRLLNDLERQPCPLALAERDSREALRDQQSLTAAFFGDPLPGLSALDRRQRESVTRVVLVV